MKRCLLTAKWGVGNRRGEESSLWTAECSEGVGTSDALTAGSVVSRLLNRLSAGALCS